MKRLPAEWEKQECVMLTYPHKKSDWICCLQEIKQTYKELIYHISRYQKCLVLCDDKKKIKKELKEILNSNIYLFEIETNDTWIRDYGAIDLYVGDEIISLDFTFNGWGGKFEASLDNKINQKLYSQGIFINRLIKQDLVLEGGSIDTNGKGVLLTTSKCLLNPNRNPNLSKEEIELKLKTSLGIDKIIWLENGALVGDDTDSHIDTLARFLNSKTIGYVKCYDKNDSHFDELERMEKELEKSGFKLQPLPLPHPKYYQDERLPATYLNFLFLNGALLLPVYNDTFDEQVITFFKNFYKNIDIIPIDSTTLIREYGSIHCATMQRYTKLQRIDSDT